MYSYIHAEILSPMNSDNGILDAARVSFAKAASLFNDEQNGGLLKYLKTHTHWSPYGHAREIFSFYITQSDLVHFLLYANTAGFTWKSLSGGRLYLSGSAWAYYENLSFLPQQIADSIRGWYYAQERYRLSAPLLFKKPFIVDNTAVNVQPRDIVEMADLVFVSFRIKAPIFLARQAVKHQIDLCWNEESRRYIDTAPEFFKPEVWRARPENGKIKQGSSALPAELDQQTQRDLETYTGDALELYNRLIEQKTAPELARMVLPQNMMVNWIWTGSVSAWKRVCNERLAPNAQEEIKFLAKQIDAQMQVRVPETWYDLSKNPIHIERG